MSALCCQHNALKLSRAFQKTPLAQALQTQLALRHGKSGQAAAIARDQTQQAATAGLPGCSIDPGNAEAAGAVLAADMPQLQAAQGKTQGATESTASSSRPSTQPCGCHAQGWHMQPTFTFKGTPSSAVDEGFPFPNSAPQVWSLSSQPTWKKPPVCVCTAARHSGECHLSLLHVQAVHKAESDAGFCFSAKMQLFAFLTATSAYREAGEA